MMQQTTDDVQTTSRRRIILAIAAVLAAGGLGIYTLWQSRLSQPSVPPQPVQVSTPKIKTVTALGRLEPKGEVIKLSAPTSSQESRIDRLLVQEGNRVKAGQAIAILDSRDRLQASWEQAQEEVKVAEANLAQVQAGAKRGQIAAQRSEIARLEAQYQGDIEAQAATVSRLESELKNAQIEYNRYETLYRAGAETASQRDSKRLTLETAQKACKRQKHN